MRKKFLHREQTMSNATHIAEASRWADWLTQRETRCPGDIENAWRRLETRYGVPFSTFWSLRYRKPKDIWTLTYLTLKAAYDAEKARQRRLLDHEEEIAERIGFVTGIDTKTDQTLG